MGGERKPNSESEAARDKPQREHVWSLASHSAARAHYHSRPHQQNRGSLQEL